MARAPEPSGPARALLPSRSGAKEWSADTRRCKRSAGRNLSRRSRERGTLGTGSTATTTPPRLPSRNTTVSPCASQTHRIAGPCTSGRRRRVRRSAAKRASIRTSAHPGKSGNASSGVGASGWNPPSSNPKSCRAEDRGPTSKPYAGRYAGDHSLAPAPEEEQVATEAGRIHNKSAWRRVTRDPDV